MTRMTRAELYKGLFFVMLMSAGCVSVRDGRFQSRVEESGEVDTLEYFLQADDTNDQWTINGADVTPGEDPDETGAVTCFLNKWSNPDAFEVMKVTDSEIQMRYEVIKAEWIRRFEERGREGTGDGCVWMRRHMAPGGEGFVSSCLHDDLNYNKDSRTFDFSDAVGWSMQTYIRVEWATNEWPQGNRTGFDIGCVLRRIDEWHDLGLVMEDYDYAKGKGLVNWRWLENVDRLVKRNPAKDDASGHIFRCENGQVYVESFGSGTEQPIIYKYDLSRGEKGRQLEVVRRTSHRAPAAGPQWYVVYRDLSREGALVKKMERIGHDDGLPGWGNGDKTLVDLPYAFTSPPKHLASRYERRLDLVAEKEKEREAVVIPGLEKGISISNLTNTPDGEDRRFILTGDWADNAWCFPDPGAKAVWQPFIREAGRYQVEIWYGDDPNKDHATDAKFTVFHAGGSDTFTVNLRERTRTWIPLGTFDFNEGWDGRVELSGDANGNLVANAVRFLGAEDIQ